MILLKMSSEKLSHSIREKIFDEIIEHMKSSGAYDEIRVGLMDPIWSHPRFQHIIQNFEIECEKFCKDVDLNQTRSYLRSKLNDRFQHHSSTSKDLVKDHIQRFLSERDRDLRSKYCEHARNVLKRFLPIANRSVEDEKVEASQNAQSGHQVEDMDIELTPVDNEGSSSMDICSSNEAEEELKDDDLDDFNDFINEEDIERPRYSPIGNPAITATDVSDQDLDSVPTKEAELEQESPLKLQPTSGLEQEKEEVEQGQSPCKDISVKLEKYSSHPNNQQPQNQPPPPDDDEDELERLTFSSVSTVSTAELSGYDNLIELSDDEANIVGKPKNSSVPIEVVQGQISDLQTTSEECKPSELFEASESDGGCSETNATGKRVARTRKSNPRYSNGDFKLL